MDTIEIIRTVVGIFLIVEGLVATAYEQFHEMKYIDQINGVLNGFVCLIVGILVASYSLKQGILVGSVALVLWAIEKMVLIKISKNKSQNK